MDYDISPWGATTDGLGHLFVCDMVNACVQMFSVIDGSYLGYVVKKGEEGFGTPRCARWYKDDPSLLVAHKEGDKRNISVINVDPKSTPQETSL